MDWERGHTSAPHGRIALGLPCHPEFVVADGEVGVAFDACAGGDAVFFLPFAVFAPCAEDVGAFVADRIPCGEEASIG